MIFSIFWCFCTLRFQIFKYWTIHQWTAYLLFWCINLNFIKLTRMTGFVLRGHICLYDECVVGQCFNVWKDQRWNTLNLPLLVCPVVLLGSPLSSHSLPAAAPGLDSRPTPRWLRAAGRSRVPHRCSGRASQTLQRYCSQSDATVSVEQPIRGQLG